MLHDPPAPPPPEWVSLSGVSERFRAASRDVATPAAGPIELLPSRLATVVAAVLGADAAGISMLSDDFRIPLGSSSTDAAAAERIQFTAEQGPCWEAITRDLPLAAAADLISARWPQFGAELTQRTPFRSAVSVPLRVARRAGGAVDLYFEAPDGALHFELGDATAVSAHVADILNAAGGDGRGRPDDGEATTTGQESQGPPWARGPAARGRTGVWIAAGMLMAGSDGGAGDALAVMRAAAYSANTTVDELAADLIEGRVRIDQLIG